jgi:HD-GYP domain-containing protein (c-di-GMP phosphodiesterase class II)
MSHTVNTELREFIRRLTTAAATASLYQLEHSQVSHLCQQAQQHLRQLFTERDEFTLMLIEERLIFDEQPVENDFSIGKLCNFMQQQGIAHLTLKAGLSDGELLRLIELLSKKGHSNEKIEATEHLRVGQLQVQSTDAQFSEELEQQLLSLQEIEAAESERFQEIYEAAKAGKRLHVRGLGEIVSSFIHAFSEQGSSLMALAPLRNLDEYTYTHSTNVCILNIAQSKMLGIDGQMLYEIGIAAMLHDIGKLFVPAEILQKKSALNQEEWAMVQQHPQLGAEYLLNTPDIPRLAVITAYEHHMRFDNSGYPKVPKRWPQHICSHMTAISDFFDALRTHRSYSPGMDFDKISTIMLEEAGTTVHPLLTKNFLNCIRQLDERQLH